MFGKKIIFVWQETYIFIENIQRKRVNICKGGKKISASVMSGGGQTVARQSNLHCRTVCCQNLLVNKLYLSEEDNNICLATKSYLWTDSCKTAKLTLPNSVLPKFVGQQICSCMPRHICFETKLYFSSNKILFNLEGDKSNRSRSFFLGKGDTADKTTFSAGRTPVQCFLGN